MSQLAHRSNVVLLDIGADEYDDQIRRYNPSLGLSYRFKNPGTVAVGQRPNPDRDPARVDVSGEIWRWRVSDSSIAWDQIILISPLKEAMKAFVCYYIENFSWGAAAHHYNKFKVMQDILKNPSVWPWTQEHVLRLMAAQRTQYEFGTFKNFYVWAEDMHIPGFERNIAHRIKDIPWHGQRPDDAKRTRKHVLSLSEERLLREALRQTAPYQHEPVPTSYSLDAEISLVGVCSLLGYGDGYRTIYHANITRILDMLAVEPVKGKNGKKYCDRFYRMGDVIPAIHRVHIANKLDHLRNNIACHLAYALGPRAAQIAGMDEEGFKKVVDDGVTYYSIDVPRRKKRYEGKAAKRRKFPAEIGLGQKIEEYIQLKREAENKGLYERRASGPVPLLYASVGDKAYWQPGKPTAKPTRPVEEHTALYIAAFARRAGVNRSSKEFRANVAQRLADAGYSAELIAEVLDHDRLNHVKAYVQAALGLSEILEKALAKHDGYQEHVAKLRGATAVMPLKNITKNTDVISGVVNHKLVSGIGGCDRRATGGGPCDKEIVFSCYGGCNHFHPFDDVTVHQQVLEALEAEVVEIVEESGSNEPVKLAFTFQESILDVKAVIQLVEEFNDDQHE